MFQSLLDTLLTERSVIATTDGVTKCLRPPKNGNPHHFIQTVVKAFDRHRSRETRILILKVVLNLLQNGIIKPRVCQDLYFDSVLEKLYVDAGTWWDALGALNCDDPLMRDGHGGEGNDSQATFTPQAECLNTLLPGNVCGSASFSAMSPTPPRGNRRRSFQPSSSAEKPLQPPPLQLVLPADLLHKAVTSKRVSVDVTRFRLSPPAGSPTVEGGGENLLAASLLEESHSSDVFGSKDISPPPEREDLPQHQLFQFARKLGQIFITADVKTLLNIKREEITATPFHPTTVSRHAMKDQLDSIQVPALTTSLSRTNSPLINAMKSEQNPILLQTIIAQILDIITPLRTPSLKILIGREIACPTLPKDLRETFLRILVSHSVDRIVCGHWVFDVTSSTSPDAVIHARFSLHALRCYLTKIRGGFTQHEYMLPAAFHALLTLASSFEPSVEHIQTLHVTLISICTVIRYKSTLSPRGQEALQTLCHEVLSHRGNKIHLFLKRHTLMLLTEPSYLEDVLIGVVEDLGKDSHTLGAKLNEDFPHVFWESYEQPLDYLTRQAHLCAVLDFYASLGDCNIDVSVFDFLVSPYTGVLLPALSEQDSSTNVVLLHFLLRLMAHKDSALLMDTSYMVSTIRYIYLSFLFSYCDIATTTSSASEAYCCYCVKILTAYANLGGDTAREMFHRMGVVDTLASEIQLEHTEHLGRIRSGNQIPSLQLRHQQSVTTSNSDSQPNTQRTDVNSGAVSVPNLGLGLGLNTSSASVSAANSLNGKKFTVPKLKLQFAPPTAYYVSATDESSVQEIPLVPVLPMLPSPGAVDDDRRGSNVSLTPDQQSFGQRHESIMESLDLGTGSPNMSPKFGNVRKKSKLYMNSNVQVHIVYWLLCLLVGPDDRLDNRFCHSTNTTKMNVLYLLRKHINHPINRNTLVKALIPTAKRNARYGVWILAKILCSEGTTTDLYKIKEKIGSGAYATVFSATDLVFNNCQYAMKQIPVPSQIERHNTFIDIHNEIYHLHVFRHRAGVSQMIDFGSTDTYFYVVMEKYPATLRGWARSQNAGMTESMALNAFLSAIRAVEILHLRKMAHCDVKGENFFLQLGGANGSVVIGDLGDCVKASLGNVHVKGTEVVRPPEVLMVNRMDDRRVLSHIDMKPGDVWALGALLFEIATGEYLFDSSDYGHFVHTVVTETEPLFTKEQEVKLAKFPRIRRLLSFILIRNPLRRPIVSEVRKRCEELIHDVGASLVPIMTYRARTISMRRNTPRDDMTSPTAPRTAHASIVMVTTESNFSLIIVNTSPYVVLCCSDADSMETAARLCHVTHFLRLTTETSKNTALGNSAYRWHPTPTILTHPLDSILTARDSIALRSCQTWLQTCAMDGQRVAIACPNLSSAIVMGVGHLIATYGLMPLEAVVEVLGSITNPLLALHSVSDAILWVSSILEAKGTSAMGLSGPPASPRSSVSQGHRCPCGQCRVDRFGAMVGPTFQEGLGMGYETTRCTVCRFAVSMTSDRSAWQSRMDLSSEPLMSDMRAALYYHTTILTSE